MLFFKRNHGFNRRRSVISKLINQYSGWLPLIAVFSLGIFGSSIYYKNKPVPLNSEQVSFKSNEINKLSKQLLIEKDITDSLSDKNIELEEKLNDALAKSSDKNIEAKLKTLNEELFVIKQTELKLSDENKKLKKQLEAQLSQTNDTQNKIISDLKKVNLETVKTLTQQLSENKQVIENINNKNNGLNTQLKEALAKIKTQKTDNAETLAGSGSRNSGTAISDELSLEHSKNLNKVKIDTNNHDSTQNRINQLINRNIENANPESQATKTQATSSKDELKNNKERIMKLKKGETLWDLAQRAYGKGHYYKKIIKANKKITKKNYKSLRPGTKVHIPFIK